MEKRIQMVNKSPIRYKQITRLIFLICFAFYNIVAYAAPGAIKGKVTVTESPV